MRNINRKLIWLKVASFNIFHIAQCMIASPSEQTVPLNQNGWLFQKVTIKYIMNQMDFNKHNIAIYMSKILGWHTAASQKWKVTYILLLTNKKAKTTFSMRLLCPNHPVAIMSPEFSVVLTKWLIQRKLWIYMLSTLHLFFSDLLLLLIWKADDWWKL